MKSVQIKTASKTRVKPNQGERLGLVNTMLANMGLGAADLARPALYQGAASPQGEVCLANESLFTQDHYSEPLTTLITDWPDPVGLDVLMDYIMPPVEVSRRFEFKQAENAEAFIMDSDDIRAIGASFKEVTYTENTVQAKTLNKGLTVRLDNDQYTDLAMTQERLVKKLRQRLLRSEYARGLAVMAAAATNNPYTWSSGARNPMADMRTVLLAGELLSGLYANRILWAKDAWATQQGAFEALNTPSGYNNAKSTPQQIAETLLCDKGMVTGAVYQSGAASKARLAAGLIFFFYALDGVDQFDPSHLKRFWSPTESGPMRVYTQVYAKFVEVTLEHYSLPVATTTLGVEAITVG
jgi:hypothetical protein